MNALSRIDPGEPRLSTQSTTSAIDALAFGADGTYIFSRLPAGTFVVNVTDRAGLLGGYWHSLGTAGANNHSQADPYALTLAAGGENLSADFGYYVEPAALSELIDTYERRIGPRNGARVVARAWADAAFRDWLARDATAAIASLGYTGRQGEHMVALFNTPQRHNLVVCTLCSCYPWPVLGLPPTWYKSSPYRSRP